MKKLLILLLLVAATVKAQQFGRQSLEMSVGRNLYSDKLGNSRGDILVNTGYRYMVTPTFGLQGFWQFDVIRAKQNLIHTDCDYAAVSHNFRLELFKRLARFGRFTVNGTAGLGTTFLYLREDARARAFNYTAAGNILYSLGEKRNPWGSIKLEYRGIANTDQDYTLNNKFRTTSNPIQAYKQDVSVGLVVYLDNKRNKTHADWTDKRKKMLVGCTDCNKNNNQPIITNIVEPKKEMVIPYEVVLFDEGSADINTDAQRASIIKMVEFLNRHPDVRVEVVGAACGGKGSPERNFELSQLRAKAVYSKIASLRNDDYSRLSYRGTGVDTKYRHKDQDVQKRVNFVIYK